MIEKIHLENFKNHKDTTIKFGRLTALTGPNGVGKTSVLEGLYFPTSQFKSERSEPQMGLSLRTSSSEFCIFLNGTAPSTLSDAEEHEEWHLEIQHITQFLDDLGWSSLYKYTHSWGSDSYFTETTPYIGNNRQIKYHIRGIEYFSLKPRSLEKISTDDSLPPRLSDDGEGLAALISYLLTTRPERYNSFLDLLTTLVPQVKRVRTQPTKVTVTEKRMITVEDKGVPYEEERKIRGDELRFDMASGDDIPADQVSTGTLIATALAAALVGTGDEDPHTLLIDDIEKGLHPKAQIDLVQMLRKLTEEREDLQIVFTTHSPYVIDELDPEEVYLLNTDDEGIAHAKRLSDHPDADRALQVLTTGEFWSAEGEDWVLDSNGDG